MNEGTGTAELDSGGVKNHPEERTASIQMKKPSNYAIRKCWMTMIFAIIWTLLISVKT